MRYFYVHGEKLDPLTYAHRTVAAGGSVTLEMRNAFRAQTGEQYSPEALARLAARYCGDAPKAAADAPPAEQVDSVEEDVASDLGVDDEFVGLVGGDEEAQV